MRRTIVTLLVLILVLSLFPAVSMAAPFTISANGTYDLDDFGTFPVITIEPGLSVTFVGDTGVTYLFVRFVCGEGVSLTIQDVHIESPSSGGSCAISFSGEGNALTLTGTNIIGGSDNVPCVRVEEGTELTINGPGSLQVSGGMRAAGIGGGNGNGCGSITIAGGGITATGGMQGAGIGGGYLGSGGNISVTGGTVNATGGTWSAGVGGGFQGSTGNISISGGSVTAVGDPAGSGIGSGYQGGSGVIRISGGTVIARSPNMGAGIGGAWYSGGDHITISGGDITATGGWGGAGIGGGYQGIGGTVVIEGGSVKATGGTDAKDIGAGKDGGGGGTLDIDNCAEVELAMNGTNASVTFGNCYIKGAGAGALAGAYVDGELFEDTVIDVADDDLASGSGYTVSGSTVTLESSSYDFLILGDTTDRSIVVDSGVETGVVLFDTGIELFSGSALAIESGASAQVQLLGSSVLKSGTDCAGLQCPEGASLSITGSGSLTAEGGTNGSGIGGGNYQNAGSITIGAESDVTASGGEYGAGIGGGYYGNSGTIVVAGGQVIARGGRCGAGIGSGFYADGGGTISVTGGTVTATGGDTGAGLGGGNSTGGGTVTIEGGTVTAKGGGDAAAIGGGIFEGGGDVRITGGLVFAQGGAGQHDIGPGANGSGGTLEISGTADVLLRNDSCVEPADTAHTHLTVTELTDGKVYGIITLPDGWAPDFGAYLRFYTLTYNANNGLGTEPESATQYKGTTDTVENGSGLSRTHYEFSGWNTSANGNGAAYAPGDEFTYMSDTTLYAQWTAKPVLVSSAGGGNGSGTIYTGGRITLTPNIPGGTWEWDEEYFSATFNSPATFTAIKAGTSSIIYTVDGVSISYEVTIEESKLPGTGQDFTWVYVLAAFAALAASGGVLLRGRKPA